MGLFLAAGWVLVNVVARRRATVAVPTLLVLVLLYGARTVHRNADWRDERTFFEATLRYAPTSAVVHGNLGRVYFESGEIEKAKGALARAVEIEPSHVRSSDAYNLLGMIAQSEGHPEEAIRLYRRAIEINARPADAYTNLASVLLDLGRVDEARGALEAALHADPTLPVAHVNLGNILVHAGDIAGALREYQRAIQFDPSYPLAHRNLGRLYLLQGRPELAEAEFRAALSLEPDSVSARQGLEAAVGMQSQRRRNH
jgi:tetratricopeptide (TPR) repeat protein